jgi:cyclopropane fatty-acyl-phospholipid synthase-like methyltransferase
MRMLTLSGFGSSGLQEDRLDAVLRHLRARRARSILDLGCGGGDLLLRLALETGVKTVVGVDVAIGALHTARMRLARLPQGARSLVTLRQHSFAESDAALTGFDAAVMLETIEHVDSGVLPKVEQAVFGSY